MYTYILIWQWPNENDKFIMNGCLFHVLLLCNIISPILTIAPELLKQKKKIMKLHTFFMLSQKSHNLDHLWDETLM